MTAVAFAVLAAIGALVRWRMGVALPRPLGTLAVNVVGAFLLALFIGGGTGGDIAVSAGGLGALTTFSTVIDDLNVLWARRQWHAVMYGSATVALGVGAALVGLQLS